MRRMGRKFFDATFCARVPQSPYELLRHSRTKRGWNSEEEVSRFTDNTHKKKLEEFTDN